MVIGKGKRGSTTWLALQCDECSKEYERKFTSRLEQQDTHFCSRGCLGKSHASGRVREKKEQTCLERYGNRIPARTAKTQEKTRQVWEKRYGGHPLSHEEVQKKVETTSRQKYGTRRPQQNEKVKSRTKRTCQERYGTVAPTQNEEVLERRRVAHHKRWGVDNPSQRDEVKRKKHETMKRNCTYRTSKPEELLYACLVEYFGIADIVRQVRMNRRVIDFYVKSIDTYIQMDGVYWHGLDRPLEEIKKFKVLRDESIYRVYLRDRAQDLWFKEQGMRLLRITDSDLKGFDVKSITKWVNCG